MRFPESNWLSLEAMSTTLLASSTATTVTLGALGTIVELSPQTQIRENLQRDVSATARLEGADLGIALALVQEAVGRATTTL
jgi:hypothetical protein